MSNKDDEALEPEVMDEHDSSSELLEENLSRALKRSDEQLPDMLVCLPLNQRPVFPTMVLPLMIPSGRLAAAVQFAVEQHDGFIGFFLSREPLEEDQDFSSKDLYRVGCIAKIVKAQDAEEGGIQIFAQVLTRFAIEEEISNDPHVIVKGSASKPKVDANDTEVRALAMAIVTALKDLIQYNPVFADEIKMVLSNYNNIDGPGRLADLAASLTTASREDIQDVLNTYDVVERMEKVLSLLNKESELTQLKFKIAGQIENKMGEQQRKFFLTEQLKAIKEELGMESDEKSLEIKRFQDAFQEKREKLSEEVRQTIEEELNKLSMLEPASAEYGVARNRLEWLTDMPWGEYTQDQLNLKKIRKGLNDDHYGMSDVKDRFIEFCGVRKLNNDKGGGIVVLVGPPGTGKTSIGQSIARNLGREFYRFSVGGMRDEAEIKGHRRTYVGALPGKLAQALRRCGSMNPVILLDEIDKLAKGMQGDPASALLEVLDPEQNREFLDHYLDVRIDLSHVLFICTANDLAGVPDALRDRMEIIRLPGYIEAEKVKIAASYLVPKQRKAHGLKRSDIQFQRSALKELVRGYAREAGVRQLEQLIAKICRKVATEKAEDENIFTLHKIRADSLNEYLGKPYMSDEDLIATATPGVVTGLAWTAMGGATLEIEAIATSSEQGGLTLTGQLGDVMKESASLTRSYIRSRAADYGINESWFDEHHLHVHFPAGATPKDGPSAGISIATALVSLALNKAVKRKLGMTGELTLTGRVYPIGGVREKIVAAKRAGLKTIILPNANERDFAELPDYLKKGYSVHFVEQLDDVLRIAGLIKD